MLEYLNAVSGRLPKGPDPTWVPDATGVGWVYQYAVLAKDRTLAELRTLQDWYIRYQLTKAAGVAEVAFDRRFRPAVPGDRGPGETAPAYGIPLMTVAETIRNSNRDVGGRTLEMAKPNTWYAAAVTRTGKADIENLV